MKSQLISALPQSVISVRLAALALMGLVFTAGSARAHEVTPDKLEITLVNVASFRVADSAFCSAFITVTVKDPTICVVIPSTAFAITAEFIVLPNKSGSTDIFISWEGHGTDLFSDLPCVETNGAVLPVTVTAPSTLPAAEVVRLGTPPNPNALLPGQTSAPIVGATWDPVIDHTEFLPDAVVDLVGLTPTSTNLPGPLGTLLCDFSVAIIFFESAPGDPFEILIPNDSSFVGLSFCAQGISSDGLEIQLTNALLSTDHLPSLDGS